MCAIRTSRPAVFDLKYHLVWTPKYRRQILTGEVAQHVRESIQRVAEAHGMWVDTLDVPEDHVHIFLEALPKYSPARVAQILKSVCDVKSSSDSRG